ncbi:glycosyltransferase [Arthrobacter sp. MA-N2]|uniref:glycosyltransferase n=1 Tax=Arthrobacter sp. MA-N2 TaxID=1101188 RepID=UPI0009DF1284|nr:glycosyltransferase [Arthrobacter sp. MA-N2]
MTPSSGGLAIEIVVPVFSESAILDRSIRRLADYLSQEFLYGWVVAIDDNASTDATGAISRKLASELPSAGNRRLKAKGRGFALRDAWTTFEAKVIAYLDVDLSPDSAALPPLIAPLLSGHSDFTIGTRLGRTGENIFTPVVRFALKRIWVFRFRRSDELNRRATVRSPTIGSLL